MTGAVGTPREARVCFASYAFDPQTGGGYRMYARYFPGLRERGISPEIVSGTQKASKLGPEDLASEWARLPIGAPLPVTSLNGTRVQGVRLPDPLGRERAAIFFRALLDHCRDPKSRPDIVNLMMTFSAASLSWVCELRRLGIPLVYSLTIVPSLPKNPLKRFFKVQMLRRHYRLMDALIVMCLYQERWLREIGIDKPIAIMPNGVDAARFRPPRDESERLALRNQLGFAADDEVLITIGAVSPRKGTDLAIEALRLVLAQRPHARLVILGLRSDLINLRFAPFRRRLEGLLADPRLAARVRFMGIVDNPHEYLRASDLYLFASHRESIPNSMFEAMASGLPTVIAPFLGWGEDCGEPGRDYLLAKHDPESLASGVTKILEDSALRASLAKSGHAWTQEFMNPDIPLGRFAALYQQLAPAPAPR